MTGPEHYKEAERLLTELANVHRGSTEEPGLIAEAQVHATLALAAATAIVTDDEVEWVSVLNPREVVMTSVEERVAGRGVVHRCPPFGVLLTPCCRRSPFELPRTDMLTLDDSLVTCEPEVSAGADP